MLFRPLRRVQVSQPDTTVIGRTDQTPTHEGCALPRAIRRHSTDERDGLTQGPRPGIAPSELAQTE
jgi:hypothetical protein